MKGYGIRGVGYVLAVALLAATSSVSITVAQAQQSAQGQFNFNIPAKPVTQAVNDIGRISGLSVVFRENQVITANGNPVRGSLTPQQALSTLLAGTGLTYRFSNASTVQIYDPATSATNGAVISGDGSTVLDTIVVEGQSESAWGPVVGLVATRSATGSKTDAALIETPQSISVVGRKEMEERGIGTVSEALRYTPGVLSGHNGLQTRRFDHMFIRGFGGFASDAQYPTVVDGLNWPRLNRNAPQFDPYNLERIEVLKGPAGVLYGQNQPGGVVNVISKFPLSQAHREVFTTIGNYSRMEGGFDIGGPVDTEGQFLYRLFGLGRMSETQIDFQDDQRVLIAPSFTWAPSDATKLTIYGSYERDPKTSDGGFLPAIGTVLPNPLGMASRNFFQGDPNWNLYSRTQSSVGYQFEHEINDRITLRSNARYAAIDTETKQITVTSLAPDYRTINREALHYLLDGKTFSQDTNLELKFDTGDIYHTLLAGVDFIKYNSTEYIAFSSAPSIDYFNPIYFQNINFTPYYAVDRKTSLRQTGIYLQDQIKWENWNLWLSGRHDWAKTSDRIWNDASQTINVSSDSAFTWRAGLLYAFDSGFSPYVSYATSFQPQFGSDYANAPFEPQTAEQVEVGLKYAPPGMNALFSVALFDIKKQNVPVPDSDPSHVCATWNGQCTALAGEVRSRGLELEAKATFWDNFDLVANYAFTDAKITKSSETTTLLDGTVVSLQGNRIVAVPEHMAGIYGTYHFRDGVLGGLSIGAGVRYIGPTYGTSSNVWNEVGYIHSPSKVPDFALVDAALNYDFGISTPDLAGLRLVVSATNLLDKTYVASCNSNVICQFGEGRTVKATLSYKW